LAGCHLLFSGVIEHGTDPKRHPIWTRSEAFGAKCYTERTPEVTHIVARRGGTEKIKSAKKEKANVYLVRPDWLRQSLSHWKRQNEHEYPLTDFNGKTPIVYPVLLGNEPTIIAEPVEMEYIELNQPTVTEVVNEEDLEKEFEREFDDIIDSDMEKEIDKELGEPSEDSQSDKDKDIDYNDYDNDDSWDG